MIMILLNHGSKEVINYVHNTYLGHLGIYLYKCSNQQYELVKQTIQSDLNIVNTKHTQIGI